MGAETRIVNALKQGWSLGPLKKASSETSRHSLWAMEPDEEGWVVHKVHGGEKDWVNKLLDEAGVL
jgi:hypothetical protein